MSEFQTENSNVYPINTGAMDFLLEPVDPELLQGSVRRHPSGHFIGKVAAVDLLPDVAK